MAVEPNRPDMIYKLCETLIREEYCKNPDNDIKTIHRYVTDIWLRQIYMDLLLTYELTPESIQNYTYHLTDVEADEYLNQQVLEHYMYVSRKFYELVPRILKEQYNLLTTDKIDQLKNYYMNHENFTELQWQAMLEKIMKNNEPTQARLEIVPRKFLEALQLQYLFGIQTLPSDFAERVEILQDNLMLFAPVVEGGPQNYVLFRGFVKHPLMIIRRGLLSQFCMFLDLMFDTENNNVLLRRVCDNLIYQTINSISYSKAIVRNTQNDTLRKSIGSLQELIIENQDLFPKLMEEYDVKEDWVKFGKESIKMKVFEKKVLPEEEYTDVSIDEEKKPKKNDTELDQIQLTKRIKEGLETLFKKIRKTKNQPKNGIIDAGFLEN